MEIEKTRTDIALANQDLESNTSFANLKVQLETAQNEVESRQDEIKTIQKNIQNLPS